MGAECGGCGYVRNRYYEKGTSQQEVNITIAEEEGEAERHQRLRADKVTGECKFVHTEAVNTKSKTSVEKQSFREAAEEGTCNPLKEFARIKGLSFPAENQLEEYITKTMGFEIEDADGGRVVVQPDLPAGSHRYRHGKRDVAKQMVVEGHVDQAAAERRHAENMQEGALGKPERRVLSKTSSPPVATHRPIPRSQQPLSGSWSWSLPNEAFDEDPDHDHDIARLSDVDSSIASSTIRTPAPKAPQRVERCLLSAGGGRKRKRISEGDLSAAEAAEAALNDADEYFSADILWSGKYKKRGFENQRTKLAAKAAKAAASVGVADSAEVSEKLFKKSVDIYTTKETLDLFKDRSQDFVEKLDDLPGKFNDIFKSCSQGTQANMLSSTVFTLLSTGDIANEVMALKVAKYDDCCDHFSVATLARSGCSEAFVSSCQVNLVVGFIDKMIKKPNRDDFVKLMKSCECTVGKGKISNRLQCYMKVSGGNVSHAKVAWERIPIPGRGEGNGASLADNVVNDVVKCVHELEKYVNVEEQDSASAVERTFSALQDVIMSNSAATFSKYMDTVDDEGDHEGQQLYKLKDDLVSNIFRAQQVVVDFSGGLAGFVGSIFSDDFSSYVDVASDLHSDANIFIIAIGAANTLLQFDIPAAERAVLKEASQRCEVAVKVCEANAHTAKRCDESRLASWSEIWELESKVQVAPKANSESRAHPFQEIVDCISKMSSKGVILSVVRSIVGSPKCELAAQNFFFVIAELIGALPPEVSALAESAKACRSIKVTAEQVLAGKAVGCMQSTSALRLVESLIEPVSTKTEVQEWRVALLEQWGTSFQELVEKLGPMCMTAFIRKYRDQENIIGLVQAWTFDQNMWLASSEKDPKRNAEFQQVEAFMSALPSAARIIDELAKVSLQWISESQSRRLKSLIEDLPAIISTFKKGATLMSTVILTNAVLVGKSVWTSKRYISERLGVTVEELPPTLQAKLSEREAAAADGASTSAAAQPAASHSASAAGASAPPAAETAASAKPKLQLKLKKNPITLTFSNKTGSSITTLSSLMGNSSPFQ
ncbi:unnamed protein product, partial [Prorocentrum cordatum]